MTGLLWRLLRLLGIVRGLAGVRHASSDEDDTDPRRRELVAAPRSERTVAALLVSAGVACGAFAVLIALDADPRLLGVVLAAGLASLSAAAILAGLRLVPQEVAVEERPALVFLRDFRLALRQRRVDDTGDRIVLRPLPRL